MEKKKPDLGVISERFESGGAGPGTVSAGHWKDKHGVEHTDPGGPSYGVYQLTSQDSWTDKQGHLHIEHNGGNVARFLASDQGRPFAHDFEGLKPGTPEFSSRWKETAQKEPEAFREAQHGYIGATHFQPQVEKIRRDTGLDVTDRSATLQSVVWSTAVHKGPNTVLVEDALSDKANQLHVPVGKLTDLQCIDAIYDRRAAKDPSLAPRFHEEREFAHGMLEREQRAPHAGLRGEAVPSRDPYLLPPSVAESLMSGQGPGSTQSDAVPDLENNSTDLHGVKKKDDRDGDKKKDKRPTDPDLNPNYQRGIG